MRLVCALLIAFNFAVFDASAKAAEITGPQPTLPQTPLVIQTAKGRLNFTVEMATTGEQQQIGLMFRKTLAPNAGMLFDFGQERPQAFWMKNTLIPLDMFWTDTSGRIAWIAESVPPCTADPCPEYPPRAVAQYVIETNAGFAKRHGVKVGQVVTLKNLPK